MRRSLTTILSAALIAGLVAAPAVADEPVTIVDAVLADDGEFDILQAAVIATGYVGALDDANATYTVFAPTDKAFIKLAEDLSGLDLDEASAGAWLLANIPLATLTAVLEYHVVVGLAVDSSTVVTLDEAPTIGGTVGISAPGKGFRSIQFVDNDPDARNPKLVKGLFDIEVDNGIIHGIDRVLRPIDL